MTTQTEMSEFLDFDIDFYNGAEYPSSDECERLMQEFLGGEALPEQHDQVDVLSFHDFLESNTPFYNSLQSVPENSSSTEWPMSLPTWFDSLPMSTGGSDATFIPDLPVFDPTQDATDFTVSTDAFNSPTTTSPSLTTQTRPNLRRTESATGPQKRPTNPRSYTDPPSKSQFRAHYVIEKRYRANLNEKLNDLNRVVPDPESWSSGTGTAEGGSAARKTTKARQNKASILEKAIRYIQYLESHYQEKEDKLDRLKARMRLSLDLLGDNTTTKAGGKSAQVPMQFPLHESASLLL